MSKEYFWGDSLSASVKTIEWNPSLEDEDDLETLDSDGIQHVLFLKQAVLGANAKEGERNVVEIQTENFDGDEVKQPLFSLKLGLNESSLLDIALQPPVTFALVAGSGPVFINGQHMIEINIDEEGDEEDEEEDEEEEEEEEVIELCASPDLPYPKSKKRALSTTESVKKTKIAKFDKEAAKNEEEEDEDEDEDEEVMVEMDDDDDDDDEDFEELEDEDEDDRSGLEDEDDDDEEVEGEDSPEQPVKKVQGKKAHTNGTNGTVTAKGDNKLKPKEVSKAAKKPKGKKKAFGLEEIKKKIQEQSSLPKKEEKFKNYVRTTFHISEPKKVQDLWGWYRATLQK